MVKEIQSEDEYNKAINSGGLVVVDFTATWCGPCRAVAPRYQALSEKFPGVTFLKVDIDAHRALARAAEVSAVPTFLFFRNGAAVGDRVVGADVAALEEGVNLYK
ncbi:thioredoxin-like protein [Zopfochytrium polystomum]|nr:thioredoxin-like protein [Zopfochytrium polystomum]